jgi:5'-nucleotidase
MKPTKPIQCILLQAFFLLLCSCSLHTITDSPPRHLTILGTGDLQGHLDAGALTIQLPDSGKNMTVAGGISRIATLITTIRRENDHPVIVLSSGDDLMGRYFHKFNGKAIYELMEKSGYDIQALGNHEFDRGPEILAQALEANTPEILCTDLKTDDTPMEGRCKRYLITEYQGLKIAFFSLMTPDFPLVTRPGKVQLAATPTSMARKMVRLLRDKGADLVIAVTHIGRDMDLQTAARVKGIDIIFGGHSHDYEMHLQQRNNTLVVNGGQKGPALVRLDVELDKKGRMIPSSGRYSLIPVMKEISPDPEVEKILKKYADQLPAATILGRTDTVWDLTNHALRYRESAVADMITDIIRKQFKVDIVLYNSGAFRGNSRYQPGPVTDVMLSDIDEFESTVFLLKLKGDTIAQILEHSAAKIGTGAFLQVSGIRFTIDPKALPQILSGTTVRDSTVIQPGHRTTNIKILSKDNKWVPLDLEKTYSVAANDYLVQRGGDHYFWFKKYGRDIRNTYSTMGSIMTDFFLKNKIGGPGKPDGRIVFSNAP